LLLATATLASPSGAATWHVSGKGIDGGFCGKTDNAPCRSIGEAIALASAGDRIQVGPGVYGDLDEDGSLTPATGEEAPSGSTMILIDKEIRITSTAGASATVIRLPAGINGQTAIGIAASGAQLGEKSRGFTILGDTSTCVSGVLANSGTNGVVIEGNVVSGCIIGMTDGGEATTLRYNRIYDSFFVGFGLAGSGGTLSNSSSNKSPTCVYVNGPGYVLSKNVLSACTYGLNIGANGSQLTMIQTTLTGATQAGILSQRSDAVIRASNIFGNGLAPGANSNCGIQNMSGGTLEASDNYWGAAAGPGADPADSTCGTDPVTTSPHRSTEIAVLLTPTR
jgi:hypothetical protein